MKDECDRGSAVAKVPTPSPDQFHLDDKKTDGSSPSGSFGREGVLKGLIYIWEI